MKKKWICGVLMAVAALILLEAVLVGVMMRRYPKRVILPQELYGAQQENLHDFTLDEQGNLTAQSYDPWVIFELGEKTNIQQITVKLSNVTETEAICYYLLPDYEMVSVMRQEGRFSVYLPAGESQRDITGIRFDFTSLPGASFRVEQVVLNSYTGIVKTVLKQSLCWLALPGVLALEVWFWIRLVRRERKTEAKGLRAWPLKLLIPAAVQILLRLTLICALWSWLMKSDGGDYSRLLSWLLLIGVELTGLGAVATRYYDRRRDELYVMALIPFWALAQFAGVELLNMAYFSFQQGWYFLLNLLFCCVVAWALMILLRWGALAITLAGGVFGFWALANHYYGILRGNPLQLSDVAQAGTAANVIGNYSFAPNALVVAVVLAEAAIGVGVFATLGRCRWSWNWRRECCGLATVLVAAMTFGICSPTFGGFQAWNISSVNQNYGYLLSFCAYAKGSAAHEKPDDYSPERVENLLAETSENLGALSSSADGQEDLPNIIVIMNEAFADLPEIYDFETDVDPLSHIHNMDNTITGSLLVSVFGGGTSNTEYECLTGNSLYAFPVNSNPYVQYLSGRQQSIAWYLQSLGYSTAAYHPCYANGYRRNSNYPRLGLDPFYSIEDNLPSQEYVREFLSDRSDFENVIWLYEQRQKDQPFFLFNVTMQNHGGYSAITPSVEVTVEPELESLQLPQMEEYLSLIHASDQAFAELTDYFSQVEEDTIILMFGDHQPSLGDDVMSELEGLYQQREGYANADNMIYQSSFVIWANFDLEEASGVLTSPNYLRAMVLDLAGVELSGYDRFLLQLQQQYPAMNAFSCLDSDGVWHARGEEKDQTLDDYICLIYNNVFDKKHMNEDYF